jgi:Ca2+/Na+ antiporter
MSKQEMYAWTSLLSSISIVIIYTVYAIGLPENWAEVESQLASIFFKVFLFVLVIEIILGILKNKNEVEKDERDDMIAGKGYRNAYHFLMVAVVIVLFQMIMDDILGFHSFVYGTVSLVHVLVYVVLLASIMNRATQIFYYRRVTL